MKFQSQRRDKARVTVDAPNNAGLKRGQVVFIVKQCLNADPDACGYSVSADQFNAPSWFVADRFLEVCDE